MFDNHLRKSSGNLKWKFTDLVSQYLESMEAVTVCHCVGKILWGEMVIQSYYAIFSVIVCWICFKEKKKIEIDDLSNNLSIDSSIIQIIAFIVSMKNERWEMGIRAIFGHNVVPGLQFPLPKGKMQQKTEGSFFSGMEYNLN